MNSKPSAGLAGWACALLLGACSDATQPSDSAKPAAPVLTAVSATQLQAIVDQTVAPDPTVRVTDARGQPVSGMSVLFFTGYVLGPPVTTGADGQASMTWRLSQRAGTQMLTARIYNPVTMSRPVEVTFTANALPDSLAAIHPYALNAQTAFPSQVVGTAPVVVAVDKFSNTKPGVEVRFEATGGGSVMPAIAITDDQGRAIASDWTLGAALGTDTLIARVGNFEPLYFTAQVVPAFVAKSIVSGDQTTCAIALTDDVYCWGNNVNGGVKPGAPGQDFAAPQRVQLPGRVLSIAGGRSHTCAIVDGVPQHAYCWGLNTSGQLGSTAPSAGSGPVQVDAPEGLVAVTAGDQHSCGLGASGTAYCWGDGTLGQLGTGEITTCYAAGPTGGCGKPLAVYGNLRFVALAAGDFHTCGLVASGQLYCWGLNSNGQLGSQSGSPCYQQDPYYYYSYAVACAPEPLLVQQATPFAAVAAGVAKTCALTTSGSVNCYGPFTSGYIPNTGPVVRLSPDANCAIKDDGEAFCWLANFDAPNASASSPVQLAGGSAFSALAAVYSHHCGILKSDGTAVCWGSNESGELGNGSQLNAASPSPVLGPPNSQ